MRHLSVDNLDGLLLEPGQFIGVALAPDGGVGLAVRYGNEITCFCGPDPDASPAVAVLGAIEVRYAPRWVWFDSDTALALAEHSIAIDRCWDVIAVQRLIEGGARGSVARVWASLHDLPLDTMPVLGQLDLLAQSSLDPLDHDSAVQADGHLSPEWLEKAWRAHPQRLAQWAEITLVAATRQLDVLAAEAQRRGTNADIALSTAHAESMASLLCAELQTNGLPIDSDHARSIIAEAVGPRFDSLREEDDARAHRDAVVLQHLEPHQDVNLRNSAEVKAMLRRLDIEVEDTRARRLEQVRDAHPVVDALLTWRKAERISTTYGYRWLDENVRDGRLRGAWMSSDGSAGRMTASAGLHNLPSEMRPAIVADPGCVFVRADLGQIEPRVLAAVSGDEAFIAATQRDDLYHEVAQQLDVTREVAKLAVLGAMYGATSGESAHALRRLEKTYPVAMRLLDDAARSGIERSDVATVGGRRIRLSAGDTIEGNLDAARSAAAARGRYARNALIQGAAAEFFKVWAVIVRRQARALNGLIVLCLHDELLVHGPAEHGQDLANIVSEAVNEAAHYWSPSPAVRFVADVSVISRWSDAKP